MRLSYIKYWWRTPREVWALSISPRLMWGRCHTPGVRTWSLGPITVVHTNLDWLLHDQP